MELDHTPLLKADSGFTLVEIIMTLGVLGVLFATSVALFLGIFRSGGKTNSVVDVEQNAQLSLNAMDRLIKNAQSVDSTCPGTGSTLTITNVDGRQTTFSVITDGDGILRLASNSAEISAPEISVTALSFTCTQTEGVPEKIDISLTLNYTSTKNDINSSRTYTLTTGLRTY